MKAYYAREIITDDGVLKNSYMLVENDKIAGFIKDVERDIPIINYQDMILIPGLIDIHTHGGIAYEPGYSDVQHLRKWSLYKVKHGVTGLLPSTASIPFSSIKKAVRDVKEVMHDNNTNILGIHLEGPFFSISKKIGAQNPKYLRDNFDNDFKELIYNNRTIIKYIAVDPELPVSREIAVFCKELGIKVAAGHSEISYQEFLEEIDYGYSSITHTFNGMVGLHHRQPGLSLAGCIENRLYSEIICDGFHISYPMLYLYFKLRDRNKAILITDSMAATGMTPGSSYEIGGIDVTVDENGKVFKDDGGLAGSTLTLDKAVRNIVHNLNIPLKDAVQLASLNPAKLLGISDRKGSLAAGKDADFVVLNDELNVMSTYIKGEKVYDI